MGLGRLTLRCFTSMKNIKLKLSFSLYKLFLQLMALMHHCSAICHNTLCWEASKHIYFKINGKDQFRHHLLIVILFQELNDSLQGEKDKQWTIKKGGGVKSCLRGWPWVSLCPVRVLSGRAEEMERSFTRWKWEHLIQRFLCDVWLNLEHPSLHTLTTPHEKRARQQGRHTDRKVCTEETKTFPVNKDRTSSCTDPTLACRAGRTPAFSASQTECQNFIYFSCRLPSCLMRHTYMWPWCVGRLWLTRKCHNYFILYFLHTLIFSNGSFDDEVQWPISLSVYELKD